MCFEKEKNKVSLQGFSLIEILVAIGIFAMLSSMFTLIYVTISNNQQRTKASQLLLNNSLYALEVMARDIKNNELDYNFLVDGAECNDEFNPKNCIVFKRIDGTMGAFTQSDNQVALWYSTMVCTDYPANCDFLEAEGAELLSPDLNKARLDYVRFIVDPETDPISTDVNQQAKITIIMQTSYVGTRASEEISYTLQTTVSSRIYKR